MTKSKFNIIKFFNKFILITLLTSGVNLYSQTNINYNISIGSQNFDIGRCGVEVTVGDIGKFETIARYPDYIVSMNLTPNQNSNHKIIIKGKKQIAIPPDNGPACNINNEIFVNQLIIDEWNSIILKIAKNTPALKCIDTGLKYYGEEIIFADAPLPNSKIKDTLILKATDPKAEKIFKSCDKILAIKLGNKLPCTMNDGRNSFCDESFFIESQKNRKLSFEEALIAALNGEEIKKGAWENSEANKVHLSKLEDERKKLEIQEKANQEQAAREAQKKLWLETPEGKKFQADEAIKAKKAQEERAKVAEKEKLNLAKEFPYYAVISCGMNGNNISLSGCFSGDLGRMEINNGDQYGLYKIYHIMNRMIPNSFETNEGLVINLRNNYSIAAQNGGNLILNIKIYNRSNKIMFQKEVDKYGVIKVK